MLIRYATGMDRASLYASIRKDLPERILRRLGGLLRRRMAGEPLAYITGHREFFGIDLEVSPAVLIPRQETELLVERAIDFCSSLGPGARPLIADIGTGSGAIAVAIALHASHATVYATDISREALDVAETNIRRHGLESRIRLCRGDLLDALPRPVDLVVSNPPYIPTGDIPGLASEVQREPRSSLDGGVDGLSVVNSLLAQSPGRLRPGGRVIVEISPEQIGAVSTFARMRVPHGEVSFHRDMLGLARAVELSPLRRTGGEADSGSIRSLAGSACPRS